MTSNSIYLRQKILVHHTRPETYSTFIDVLNCDCVRRPSTLASHKSHVRQRATMPSHINVNLFHLRQKPITPSYLTQTRPDAKPTVPSSMCFWKRVFNCDCVRRPSGFDVGFTHKWHRSTTCFSRCSTRALTPRYHVLHLTQFKFLPDKCFSSCKRRVRPPEHGCWHKRQRNGWTYHNAEK